MLAKGKQINLTHEEPEKSNEIYNFDIAIRDLKKHWHQKMVSKHFPGRVFVVPQERRIIVKPQQGNM